MRADSREAFQQALKRFVQSLAEKEDPERRVRVNTVRLNTVLFGSGLIRSIEVLDLIALIEGLTGSEVADEDVTLENMRTIQAITAAFWDRA